MSRRSPRTPRSRDARSVSSPLESEPEADRDAERALWIGERLRRLALGLTTALIVSRAFWPSEPDYRNDVGNGLVWVLALLVVAGLGLAAPMVGGRFRWRWSWTDAGVVAMVGFVAAACGHALDRRPAINLAWEWGALGIAYLLLRNLPRTRRESGAVVGALAATAVAVAVYGLFHVTVELPNVRSAYLANREASLLLLNIAPGSPSQALYENRLLGSNEPTSTFGLANSLAGFLVGPLVIALGLAWDKLTRRDGEPRPRGALALAVPPIGLILYCLLLTKSRSAYLGLLAGLVVLAWRERSRVSARPLVLASLAGVLVVAALVVLGIQTGRLDRQVLTESGKSLRFRAEYWEGAWGVINESSATFWRGHGPGNFADPYVKHKLPGSSEEIKDPHNFVLEVWAAGGLRALIPMALALGLGFWNLLGPSRSPRGGVESANPGSPPPPSPSSGRSRRPPVDPDAAPAAAGWLVGFAGLGWLLALPPIGGVELFSGDFDRWLILGGAWLVALGCGRLLWSGQGLDTALLASAIVAVLVNLIAAGGISVAAVALSLWAYFAVALNLREDRPCGLVHQGGGRLAAFGVATVWVALLGTFVGAVQPYWKAEAAMVAADEVLAVQGRIPDFDLVEALLHRAAQADPLSDRPWSRLAATEYQAWMSRGGKVDDLRWRKVPIEMYKAVSPPRNPNSWTGHRERAMMTTLLLKQLGAQLSPKEITRYRADVVEASRRATVLYPTNASLRAWLAEASAEIGMIPDAIKEGREALRLDEQTPHLDKKLDPTVRQWLQGKLPEWAKHASDLPAL